MQRLHGVQRVSSRPPSDQVRLREQRAAHHRERRSSGTTEVLVFTYTLKTGDI
jgi:hypothetical protein